MSDRLDDLARSLVGWLPRQRWFADKDRSVAEVDLRGVAELAARDATGLLLIASVWFTDGGSTDYLLPVGRRTVLPARLRPELITRSGGAAVYDATGDPELMAALLRVVAAGGRGELRSTVADPELAGPTARVLAARRGDAEQSNTSVVFGDRFILKLFRRLLPGTNPELEVHRRLGRHRHVPRLAGALEAGTDAAPLTLGVVHEYFPDAIDGWRLAIGDDRGFGSRAYELGAAVAAVHAGLATAFGTTRATATSTARLRDGMIGRLADVVRVAPVLAGAADAARAVFESVDSLGDALQRVHGDLHLGQVLLASTGWLLIDFEGEPAAPIERRTAFGPPLRDLAGVLRSLDYAAAVAGRPRDGRWVAAAKQGFLRGYQDASGVDVVAAMPALRAFELDKAIYEVGYELRNRPDWVDIPLRAVRALVAPAAQRALLPVNLPK